MPFLLPFYQQFPPELHYDFKTSLSVLAGVAKNALNDAEINELSFLFSYDVKEVKKKQPIHETEQEFIQKVS